jgi:hypothetical protein
MKSGNVMDVIDVLPDETFGMVGEFKPILGKVNEMTKNVYIFEENAKRCGEVYHKIQSHTSSGVQCCHNNCDEHYQSHNRSGLIVL